MPKCNFIYKISRKINDFIKRFNTKLFNENKFLSDYSTPIRYEKRSVLFAVQRRSVLQPDVHRRDKIELLLLHGDFRPADGLG